jgi:hypothetical protein
VIGFSALKRTKMANGKTQVRSPVPKPIWFDPQRRAATPELQAIIKSLIGFLEDREAVLALRKRARRDIDRVSFHLAVECISCNLADLSLTGLDWPLAVPRSSSVMWAKGRYRVPVYGQHFVDALDLMVHPEVGLIESVGRGYSFAGGGQRQSTVKPTEAFLARVRAALTGGEAFSRAEESEVLVLKGRKNRATGRAAMINYKDTEQTRRRRKEVQRINEVLRNAPIRLVTGDDDHGCAMCFTEEGQPVDPTRRAVRRIFNNGSWREGGRLFDGFWETMRRVDRFKFLRIGTRANPDGEPIANVDFGQLFPTLAYHRANRSAPERDLYDIAGGGTSREGWKKLVNAMLFANGTLTRWPEDTSSLFPRGTKLRDALALVRHVHAPIAKLFGTGVGFKLMLIESEILIQALEHFAHQGITALPLHDSVLVGRSDAEAAKGIMAEAFGTFANDARAKLQVTIT